ncbi:MAG: hypothetical protein HY741_26375 [Chloroflexi bacterium]|nr:hypothetical protein [Chloroflexota bacterium]
MKNRNKARAALRLIRWTLFLLLGILVLVPQNIEARVAGCRTDPIVTLTNGDQVRITVEVDAPEDQVRSINYTLHAPPGVEIKNIVYTAGGLGEREHLTLVNDEQPNYYTSETVVMVGNTVAVSATSVWTATTYRGAASGYGEDTLSVRLGPWGSINFQESYRKIK